MKKVSEAKDHSKNYMKVRLLLVRHIWHNLLIWNLIGSPLASIFSCSDRWVFICKFSQHMLSFIQLSYKKVLINQLLGQYLLFINRVCVSCSKIIRPRSWSTDRVLNILQYEKQTRLINSFLDGQEMRNGKRSLKCFCDLGLKLENCWVTHRPDDVYRFFYLWPRPSRNWSN